MRPAAGHDRPAEQRGPERGKPFWGSGITLNQDGSVAVRSPAPFYVVGIVYEAQLVCDTVE